MDQDQVDWSKPILPADMTPAPPPPAPPPPPQPATTMDKSWQAPHPDQAAAGNGNWQPRTEDQPQPTPSSPPPSPGGLTMNERVGLEMKQAYQNALPALTPAARDWVANNTGWLGRNVLGPGIDVGNAVVKGAQAAGAGVTANIAELLGGGDPEKARDIHAALQILPVATAGAPPFMPNTPEVMGPQPLPRVPISAPADAAPLVKTLYQQADQSGAVLKPSVTADVVAGLEKYGPKSPAGQATGVPDDVTALTDRLRKLSDAPLTTPTSVQEVDQQISDALEKANPTDARTIRQIQQDFRARTMGNVSQDDVTGNPSGFKALQDANTGYAAQKRMEPLQKILDDSENQDNAAQYIKSRMTTFLRNPNNTKGWTDDEVAAAKAATEGGFLRDYMRTEGSRLIPIVTSATLGVGPGMAMSAGQFGVGYVLRNALENMRRQQVQDAISTLGQRVPQPGTAPLVPQRPQASGLLYTGARYAPLTSLLGQPQTQQP